MTTPRSSSTTLESAMGMGWVPGCPSGETLPASASACFALPLASALALSCASFWRVVDVARYWSSSSDSSDSSSTSSGIF